MYYMVTILFYQFILKLVTIHAYLIPKGDLLVEYAAFRNKFILKFQELKLDWYCFKRWEHFAFPGFEELSFPHHADNKQNITSGHSVGGVYLVAGLSS